GATAIVGAGMMPAAGVHAHFYNPYACPAVAVKVVDLSRPGAPRVVATIPVPRGVIAQDVSALHVRTPAFTGDLAAIALAMCSGAGSGVERGVVYYDVTDPAAPVLLGRYQADSDNVKPADLPCGPAPAGSDDRCAASQHSVTLVQRADGRVLSLSAEPGASASKFPSGDLRIVDVTDPRHPRQVSAYPPPGEPIFSSNGCRPFRAAHNVGTGAAGTVAALPFYDGGVFLLDLARSEAPAKLAEFKPAADRRVEGNFAYAAYADLGSRRIVLASEQDWIAPTTTLRIDGPAAMAGTRPACEAIFTLFDPANRIQLYRRARGELAGRFVYVGRGCSAGASVGMHADMVTPSPDPYLADPAGRIVMVDRSGQPTQPDLAKGSGCSVSDRVKRAQAAGATGVVVAQTSTTAPEAFSPDGDPAGLRIPVVMIDRAAADSLRTALCPRVTGGRCAGGAVVRGALVDAPGQWGSLHVIDVTVPGAPVDVGEYRAPQALVYPPRDLGVYSVHHAMVRGTRAYVAWNSGGLRLLDLAGDRPRSAGAFMPPDRPDPNGVFPAKTLVVGVAVMPGYVVITDINSGLYVLEDPAQRVTVRPSRTR
ncbi:MAG: hypothetical protein H0U85_03825, partial [Gemmatimonadales bacterium]|nr:hypothetical protein [Gemmatimonadales bacterium]